MLILYTKNNCKYCDMVKDAFLNFGTVYEERNISNPIFLHEVQGYGARTMPFLVDTLANTAFGESEDIISYAQEYSF